MSKQAVKLFELGFDVGFATDQGTRDNQEDSLGFKQLADGSLLAILSDGMGGHAAGEIASELAIKAFADSYQQKQTDVLAALQQALEQTQQVLSDYAQQHANCYTMGATLIAVILQPQRLYWVSVGDSLLYRCNSAGDLIQLNESHTLQERFRRLYESGSVSEAAYQQVDNPQALTSAMGLNKLNEVDLSQCAWHEQDVLLLSSDGLLTLTTTQISNIVNGKDRSQVIADNLVTNVVKQQTANQDNVSLIVIKRHKVKTKRYARRLMMLVSVGVFFGALIASGYQLLTLSNHVQDLQAKSQHLQVMLTSTQQQLAEKGKQLQHLESLNAIKVKKGQRQRIHNPEVE